MAEAGTTMQTQPPAQSAASGLSEDAAPPPPSAASDMLPGLGNLPPLRQLRSRDLPTPFLSPDASRHLTVFAATAAMSQQHPAATSAPLVLAPGSGSAVSSPTYPSISSGMSIRRISVDSNGQPLFGTTYEPPPPHNGFAAAGPITNFLPPPVAAPPLPEPPAAAARRPLADRIYNTTWVVARAFGFQTFNNASEPWSGRGSQWMPSTAFLASDHLETLLLRNVMPRLVEEEDGQQRVGGGADTAATTNGSSDKAGAVGVGDNTKTKFGAATSSPQQQETAFARSVWELHSHIFLSYQGDGGWCRQVGLAPRRAALEAEVLSSSQRGAADGEVVAALLAELALYFLLYSEAANLRHTPELMWFLFWAAAHSAAFERLWKDGLTQRPAEREQLRNARARRVAMRNALDAPLRAAREILGHDPAASYPDACAQAAMQLVDRLPELMPVLGLPSTDSDLTSSDTDPCSADLSLSCVASRELFADLVCYGDGGFWTDVIVSPLFTVLAFEIDHMATARQEVAHRLGYDDVNESLCRRDVVAKLLADLGVSSAAAADGSQALGALEALSRLGFPPAVTTADAGDAAAAAAAGGGSRDPRQFDPVRAAAFWADRVFVKTHRERRSWLALLRAFYRVYSLQLVLMHGTMVLAFAPGSLRALSSCVLTHAVVAALERSANWWLTRGAADPRLVTRGRKSWLTASAEELMGAKVPPPAAAAAAPADEEGGGASFAAPAAVQRRCDPLSDEIAVKERLAQRRAVAVEGAPVGGVFGWTEWVLVAAAMVALFAAQHMGPEPLRKMARSYWPLAAGGYTAAVVGHGLLTTRDGYAVSLSSALRLPAFLRASSQRAAPGCWLHRPMSVGWRAAALTALFWLQTLAAKLAFDYFVIMRPIAGQVRFILRRNWLACAGGASHYRIFGAQLPLRCIDADWLLVALRVAPFVLVCLVDTQIFYQLMLMVWGVVHGLVSLNLGLAGSWEGLRAEFHRAPLRWWARCMSATANKAALTAAAQARRRRRDAASAMQSGGGFGAFPSIIDAGGYGSADEEDSEYGDVYGMALSYLPGGAKKRRGSISTTSGSSLIGASAGCDDAASETSSLPSSSCDPKGASKGKGDSKGKGASKGKGKGSRRAVAAAAELVEMLSGQGDEQLAQWMSFAAAWDAVVNDLRSCDLLSDRERANLVFTRLPAAATAMLTAPAAAAASPTGGDGVMPGSPSSSSADGTVNGGAGPSRPLRPFLLPAFFYAGEVQRVVDTGSASASQQLVLEELRSLLVWMGCQLRLLDGNQAAALLTAACCPVAVDAMHSHSREKGLASLRSLLAALMAAAEPLPLPVPAASVSDIAGTTAEAERLRLTQRDEAAAALEGVLAALEVEARAVVKAQVGVAKKGAKKASGTNTTGTGSGTVAQSQQEQQAVVVAAADPQVSARALLDVVAALRRDLGARPARLSAALALLHPENGGCGEVPSPTSTSSASYVAVDLPLLLRVLSTASKMLNLSATAAQPTGAEARRILGFFITSLANRHLAKPCSVAAMPSWTVLTPLYAEDVLFPLESGPVAEALGLGPTSCPSSSKPAADAAASLPDLLTETDERVSLLAYIRSLFPKDWDNFKERLGASLGLDMSDITENDFAEGGPLAEHALALQLWASYRGQLLARTVRGMAAYERAVRVLAALECPRPEGVNRRDHAAVVEDVVGAKFTHVVASQLYGTNRRSLNLRERWLAESTDVLLQAFPCMRVSYIDTVLSAADEEAGAALPAAGSAAPPPPPHHQYAVLIRGRRGAAAAAAVAGGGSDGRTEELYRVRLPYNRYSKRGIILGEGKPENQNHAAIFCFGEALQTIDMNQDNALTEALKMRNLLHELAPEVDTQAAKRASAALNAALQQAGGGNSNGTGSALPAAGEFRRLLGELRSAERPVAVVGFREWVFSDKAGALGSFAASSEYAFSTMVQRNMAYPANVRLHYGHPDAFNKLFVMTRGGVAKATRQLHVSEDIFGGMNHSLRGGRIKFREYIACGKGRDMGFDSINAFESKISAGFGEVALSRDLLRMATRVDLWRCLHLYHSLAGNYFNTWLVMGSVYAQVYAVLFFSLARATVYRYVTFYPSPPPAPPGADVASPPPPGAAPAPPGIVRDVYAYDTIRVEHMLQLGMLLLLPYIAEVVLEHGLVRGLLAALGQVVSGSFTFFIFKQQTTTAALHRSMLYGGATYIATGRGFSITSSSFVKLFANYGRSHISLGFELGAMAVAVAATLECTACSYAGLTWGTWLAALSLVLAPCWFNPMAFSLGKVKRDMLAWAAWLRGETNRELGCTWHQWNRRQLADPRDDAGTQTDRWLNVVQNLALRAVPPALLALAAASRLTLKLDKLPGVPSALHSEWVVFLAATAALWAMLAGVLSVSRFAGEVSDLRRWRRWSFWVGLLAAGLVATFLVVGMAHWYSGSGTANLLLIVYANANLGLALHRAAEHAAPRGSRAAAALVDGGYWLMDCCLGWLLLGVLGVLSLVGLVERVQTTMLFNVTFAQSVKRGSVVKTIGVAKADQRGQQQHAVLAMMADPAAEEVGSPGGSVGGYSGGGGTGQGAGSDWWL
ncbi:hypothetical protein PLESTF_001201000 [Pleodorina starrii]|nr:hypothetical protein PLESTF_001201000 [Pleodorina starrii]